MVRQGSKRRIAFYGGSFDPVHAGHLAMARTVVEALGLDRLCFVPARQNPLKATGPEASAAHRLEMLRLAVGGESRLGIWEGELERDGPSYTLHSMEHIVRVYPNSHHFWVVGSDQLESLPRWYGIERLVRLVGFILVSRPGYEWSWPGIAGLAVYPVENAPMEVSSTGIREALRAGRSVRDEVPPVVADYLERHELYKRGAV